MLFPHWRETSEHSEGVSCQLVSRSETGNIVKARERFTNSRASKEILDF